MSKLSRRIVLRTENLESRLPLACDAALLGDSNPAEIRSIPCVLDERTYDELEFETLRQNYGRNSDNGAIDGDFTLDRTVGFADYLLLSANYLDSTDLAQLRLAIHPLGDEPSMFDFGHSIVIQGTDGNDQVEFHATSDGELRIEVSATSPDESKVWSVDPSSVRRLVIDLGEGNDAVQYLFSDDSGLREVSDIFVHAGPGDDDIEFATDDLITRDVAVEIFAGAGDDAVRLEIGVDRGGINAQIKTLVDLGAGNDGLGVRVMETGPQSRVQIEAQMGAGDDTLQLSAQHPVEAASAIDATINGGDGNDQMYAIAVDDLAHNSSFDLRLFGADGDDLLSLGHAGSVSGALNVQALGGSGSDTLYVSGENISGDGEIDVHIDGGDDIDRVSGIGPMDETGAGIGFASYRFELDGGAGQDVGAGLGVTRLEVEQIGELPLEQLEEALAIDTLQNHLPRSVENVNGRRVEYWTAGESAVDQPVVVLFSGGGESIETWTTVAAPLAENSQVIAINRPGYGQTDPVPDYSASAVAADAHAIVSRIAPGRPVIAVGHSYGGILASGYARYYPNEVGAVVFVDSSNPRQIDVHRELGFDSSVPVNNALIRISERGVRDALLSMDRVFEEVRTGPEFPAVPVIALSATPIDPESGVPPQLIALQQELADLGSPGDLRYVPDSGHYIHHDQPQTVIDAVNSIMNDDPNATPVQTTLESYLADDVPGVIAYATKNGETIVDEAIGHTTIDGTEPITTQHGFILGSITKTVTAAATLRLVEEGLVELDAPISRYLDAELIDRLHVLDGVSRGHQINVRHLLQHTSGIAEKTDGIRYLADTVASPERIYSAEELVHQTIEDYPPIFAPGTGFNYSNDNYILVGMILEAVTGLSLAEVYRSRVLDPLGMNHTSLEGAEPRRVEIMHSYFGPMDATQLRPSFDWGSGGLITTAGDLAKFGDSLFVGELFESETSLEQMTTPSEFMNYGLGIFIEEVEGKTTFSHGGFFGTSFVVVPEEKLVAVTVVNQAFVDVDKAGRSIVSAILTGKTSRAPSREASPLFGGLFWLAPIDLSGPATEQTLVTVNQIGDAIAQRLTERGVPNQRVGTPLGITDVKFDSSNLASAAIVLDLFAELQLE